MGKWKKILAGVLISSLVVGGIAAGLNYARIQNIKYAVVVPVSDLRIQSLYQNSETFEGHITTNVSQNITLSKDMIVDQVYVGKGEQVRLGQPLISFDTTISEMKLNIERLKLQRIENNLNAVLNRLENIRNGAALTSANIYGDDSDASYRSSSSSSGSSSVNDDEDSVEVDITIEDDDITIEDDDLSFEEDDMWGEDLADASSGKSLDILGDLGRKRMTAWISRPVTMLASVFTDGSESLFTSEEGSGVPEPAGGETGFSDGISTQKDEFDDLFDEPGDDLMDDISDDEMTEALVDGILDELTEDTGTGLDYSQAPDLGLPYGTDYYLADDLSDEGFTSDDEGFTSEVGEEFTSGSSMSSGVYPWLTPTPVPGTSPAPSTLEQDQAEQGRKNFGDLDDVFYLTVDWDTLPFTGSGTKEDPFVYLCSSARGAVKVTGALFNLMAGYNPEGTLSLRDEGYWYQLEFHLFDSIGDYENRKKTCVGYYLINGSRLIAPVDRFLVTEFTIADASVYPPEEEELDIDVDLDDQDFDLGGDESDALNITRDEAIVYLEKQAKSLYLDLQAKELEISKLQKVVDKKIIYAKLDGVVSKVGDISNTSSVFMTIKSSEGYYITGSVSELLKDEMQPGTKLNCTSWYSSDVIEAEVMEVSEYSVSSSGGSYSGEGNPNVSYYRFTASLPDQNLDVSNLDFLEISIVKDADSSRGLILDKAFVRMENGNYYVLKDSDGILEKQFVKVKEIVNYGSAVLIGGGISGDDKIAFPYGETAVEGGPTRDGSASDLMGDTYF